MKAAAFVVLWVLGVAWFAGICLAPGTIGKWSFIAFCAVLVLGLFGMLAHLIVYGCGEDGCD